MDAAIRTENLYYDSAVEHGIPWASFLTISLLALALAVLAGFAFYRRNIYM